MLHEIFPTTNAARCAEVANIINLYSDKFEINTVLKMSHFLGQIGAETGGLIDLSEDLGYTPRGIVKTFGYSKYADLFEGYNSDPTVCIGVTYNPDGSTSGTGKPGNIVPNFPYSIHDDIIVAYANPTLGVTHDNITELVTRNYNNGLIKVKSEYFGSNSLHFNVTYACRMGNRNIASGDGTSFNGKGFIHLTGKAQFSAISASWNADPDNNNNHKRFDLPEREGGHIEELVNDSDVAIKASMYYWQNQNLNNIVTDTSSPNINQVGAIVNGANPPNGAADRITYTQRAFEILNQ